MNNIKFIGNGDGINDKGIHYYTHNGQDFTLCGLTLDYDPLTAGDYVETKKKVDCFECIHIVEYCLNLKNKEKS